MSQEKETDAESVVSPTTSSSDAANEQQTENGSNDIEIVLDSLSTLADEACKISPTQSKSNKDKASKRKYRNKDKKQCSICGDKALGYNFDAVSCESCKAFFRRNACKRKVPDCPFTGSCKIDLNTRRFCSHCRLQKCLKVGMKKDMILDEKEKKDRIEKMKKNREQRLLTQQLGEQLSSPDGTMASPAGTIPASPSTDGDMPNTPIKQEILEEELQKECALSSEDSPLPFVLDPNQPQPMRTMSTDEEALITYLSNAYHASFSNIPENPDENSTLNHLVNYSGLIVRKLIKFAKLVDDFTCLDQESQIWLLKGVVLSTLFLRSAEHYNPDRDAWITPTSEIKTIVLKRATGYGQFHEEHMRYCKTVKPLTQDDPTIMSLLQCIALFCPDRPNVPNREIVSDIQDKYICYLKHYIESRFSFRQARYLLPKLLSKMNELQEITENHGRVLLHVNPSEIEPLMLEIFDLK